MPKAWLIALPLLLASCVGPAADVGYVDLQRAVNDCSEGKSAIAELQAEETARQKAKAEFEAGKAKAAEDKPPAPDAIPTDEQWTQRMRQKQSVATNQLFARMKRIFPAIVKARRLSVLQDMQAMVYVPTALDATDELVRRLDAGEGRDDKTAELAAARAKVAALEHELGPPKSAKGK